MYLAKLRLHLGITIKAGVLLGLMISLQSLWQGAHSAGTEQANVQRSNVKSQTGKYAADHASTSQSPQFSYTTSSDTLNQAWQWKTATFAGVGLLAGLTAGFGASLLLLRSKSTQQKSKSQDSRPSIDPVLVTKPQSISRQYSELQTSLDEIRKTVEKYSQSTYNRMSQRLSDLEITLAEQIKSAVAPKPSDIRTGQASEPDVSEMQKYSPSVDSATRHPEAIDQLTIAIESQDRALIREMDTREMNITDESERQLISRMPGHKTQLEIVNGGGSYLAISEQGRYWLFPTSQTLRNVVTSRPLDGIFDYEGISEQSPHIKQPAEIQQTMGGTWEIIRKGVIEVPA